jgi:hypothetical protein
MTQQEYENWKSGQYKSALRLCRKRFLSHAYGCFWPDAANHISRVLRHPKHIKNSIFSDCAE